MIKVGIVGGTGYTGAELLRLLSTHPDVELCTITSRSQAGCAVSDLFPNLRSKLKLCFSAPESNSQLSFCDLVFFATPNGVAMQSVPELLQANVRIIDLAADFRLHDANLWRRWYQQEHTCPELLQQAVYGLPEMNRQAIANARLVANPGCYPTAAQLGLLPLIRQGLVRGTIIIDAKSGVSGAGRSACVDTLFGEVSESFKAYGVTGHRHLPEIRQGITRMPLSSVKPFTGEVVFVPHLTPMVRGIHATLYCPVKDHNVDLQALYQSTFADEPFVDVLPAGSHPETRFVRGSNQCRIAIHRPQDGNTVVILCIIDNLVKGAAGQAVQNMNIMFGLDEMRGLNGVTLIP